MKITKSDISIALYGEIVEEITRGNESLVEMKIAIGMGEVYAYLHRYDTDTMFQNDEWQEAYLKALCVNIIAWHITALCNPNIHMEILRQNYEDAIEFLKSVQKGTVRPNWPLRPEDPATNIDDAGNIQFSSNRKRSNHF